MTAQVDSRFYPLRGCFARKLLTAVYPVNSTGTRFLPPVLLEAKWGNLCLWRRCRVGRTSSLSIK